MSADDPQPTVSACRLRAARLTTKDTTNGRPPSGAATPYARGPRRHVKGHDRLMHSLQQPADTSPPPRPSICPICGLTADNGITVNSELTATTTYCDSAGHLWSVTWLAVA